MLSLELDKPGLFRLRDNCRDSSLRRSRNVDARIDSRLTLSSYFVLTDLWFRPAARESDQAAQDADIDLKQIAIHRPSLWFCKFSRAQAGIH